MSAAPVHPDDARRGIREAAGRRAAASMELADATADLTRWIAVARDIGIGPTEIAGLAELSRRGVYDIIARIDG